MCHGCAQRISADDKIAACFQECKALNGRLIEFLKRPETVVKLLHYVTEPASMDSEDKRQFKYPFASCEVRLRPWIAHHGQGLGFLGPPQVAWLRGGHRCARPAPLACSASASRS